MYIFAQNLQGKMRMFNTSGPNFPEQHYTNYRKTLIQKGIDLVKNQPYFTIWTPRQTGKSSYFRLLAVDLEKMRYEVAHSNFENDKKAPERTFPDKEMHTFLVEYDEERDF